MHLKRDLARRDFLKLASLLPLTWLLQPLAKTGGSHSLTTPDRPNVIILVFDAWSALNLNLYGYPRNTMPNLERFADNAVVFHNHYSAGTFTTPGTASLLTGMLPWSHRAFQFGAGGIIRPQVDHQIFATFSGSYSTLGFAHNRLADLILSQAERYLDTHLESSTFNVEHSLIYNQPEFRNDTAVAYSSFEDNIFQTADGSDNSLFLGPLYRLWVLLKRLRLTHEYGANYPAGLPDTTELFRLEDLATGAINILGSLHEPALAYLHFYPPHSLYHPTAAFADAFNDGWIPVDKPIHPLAYDKHTRDFSISARRLYDQYLASWDAEVNRVFDFLINSRLLDRSYVVITSDHGEMFERGEVGHWTPLLFDPVVHVPLIVLAPGQTTRRDVHAYTSSVDILPTLASLADIPIPDWTEGRLLPEFGGIDDPSRSIFAVDAKNNASFAPLTRTSISLTKNATKLTYYKYPKDQIEQFEFYDLVEDPQELQDLFPSRPTAALRMRDELLQRLAEVNGPYETGT